ncbi:MAG: S8 family peptidase [Heliobacteriaceae bacterium]|nr:S8 family peptidase [Heliobacteriaceae bacterium]MDD4588702.1 S8 family peptidase [Heliobacteriaceae bacterium]
MPAGQTTLYPVTIHRIMQRVPGQVSDYGVRLINAPAIWKKTKGEGIKVAIIDSGIDQRHPDLQANIKGGYNFITKTIQFNDENGHGTHVAGIIAGVDNGIGIVGVAPQAAIYALKVLDENGEGLEKHVIEAIEWSITNKMDVLNLSFGSNKPNPKLRQALEKAYTAGILSVAAAGNDATSTKADTIDYPGRWSDVVITVAAVDRQGKRAAFSSQGSDLCLAAPGVNILSTYPKNRYVRMSGTSMAAPHISGAIALIQAYALKKGGEKYSPAKVRSVLFRHALDLGKPGKDVDYGYGFFRF